MSIPVQDRPNTPIQITVSDAETGDVLEQRIILNDYAVITSGNRYVKNIQVMGSTHMIAVAVNRATGQEAR